MQFNHILNTDSYKASHFLQMPPKTQYQNSYIESRGGRWDATLFFGLQMFLKEYLSRPVTREMIDEADAFWAGHGEPFNRDGWEYILEKHGGRLPISIEAVPEGSLVPNRNVLVQAVNTDPKCFWLTSYIETALIRAVWYPSTVATGSFMGKRLILGYLNETADDPKAEISFKLHDFGARGASSMETSGIGGCAHLVNFLGTDTVSGILWARKYYGEPMAGFSIPAAEHSTIICWGGPDQEIDAFRNMLKQFAKPGKLVAVVSDSYDIFNAASVSWGERLKEWVQNSGATVIVRPDSGDPTKVPVEVIQRLMDKFGFEHNSKGYKVLPPCVRVIQGDGINLSSVKQILENMKGKGLSASNIAFGMGAGLLQQVDRDTLRFAMKCSAVKIDSVWRNAYKAPVTDDGKASKQGVLELHRKDGQYATLTRTNPRGANVLQEVFRDGEVKKEYTFAEIRRRAAAAL